MSLFRAYCTAFQEYDKGTISVSEGGQVMGSDPADERVLDLSASANNVQEDCGISVKIFGASGSTQTTAGSINASVDPKQLVVTDVKDFQAGQYVYIPKAGDPSLKAWKAELGSDPTDDGTFVLTLDGAVFNYPYTIQYEKVQFTFNGKALASGAMIFMLDDSELSIVLTGSENTPELVAARVGEPANRNRFIGWNVAVSGPVVTFTARRQGKKGAHSFNANGTGVTAAVEVPNPGSGSMEDIMGTIRSSSFPDWTTSGYGAAVLFTSTVPGNRTGLFSFNRTNTGATGYTAVFDDGLNPLVTRIEQIEGNVLFLKDPALRSLTNITVSHDDTVPIQMALDYTQNSGVIVRLCGTHNISSTLKGYSRSHLVGDGPMSTIIQSVRNIRLIEFAGAYNGQGPSMISVQLENIMLNGKDIGTQGLYVKGGRNIRIVNCRFVNFLDEFLFLDEVYDSTVEKTYFTNGFRPSASALCYLYYGGPDNTNQIHFNDVVWETMVRPAVRMQSGTGGNNQVNEIYFNACKWESIYPTSNVEMYGAVNVYFNNVNFCLPRTASSRRTAGIYAENSRCIYINNLISEYFLDPNPNEPGYEPAFMLGKNTSYIQIVNAMMTGRNPPAMFDNITGCGMLTHVGAYIALDNRRVITAGQNMTKNWYNSNIRIIGLGAEPSLELHRADENTRWTYFIGRIDTAGNLRIIDGNERNMLQLAADSGETQPQMGLRVSDKWNSGNLLRLGNYRLWIDASGNLRKKNGVPTSDTDGTIV